MRIKTLIFALALLLVAGTTFAQDNPFEAQFGTWKMKLTKAEPTLPEEAMSQNFFGTMKPTPENNGMMITWKGTEPDGTSFESAELWYYDTATKKIHGLSNENGQVMLMEGEITPDGKNMSFLSTMASNPKQQLKLEVKMIDESNLQFSQTFMMDGKQVQYMEGTGEKQ